MDEGQLPYLILGLALALGVTQATLDKAGVGRVEFLPNGRALIVLGAISIPLNLLSNIGLILIAVWSLFALRLIPTLITVAVGFVGWSLAWGFILTTLRRSETWDAVLSVGIPLMLILKCATGALVIFLAYLLLQ